MKICITGASGFIGRKLCKTLVEKKLSIVAVSRDNKNLNIDKSKNIDIVELKDINKNNNWSEILNGVECIVHCAGRAHVQDNINKDTLEQYRKLNLYGTENLFNQAIKNGVRKFIFISSIRVNGTFTENGRKFTYKDKPNPSENYALSKYEAENVLLTKSIGSNIEVVVIRSPLVYGPGVKGNFLRLLDLVSSNIPLPVGNIKNLRSFIGLENLVDFIICCIFDQKANGKIFLISDDEYISTPKLIERISSSLGKKKLIMPVPIYFLSTFAYFFGKMKEYDRLVNSLQVDIEYTKKTLDWKPLIKMEEELEKTAEWYLHKS